MAKISNMAKSAKIAPPHSLILIADPTEGAIPATMSGSLIAATDTCIAVGCRSDADGDTDSLWGRPLTSILGVNPHFWAS
jgi:hypothetical protein